MVPNISHLGDDFARRYSAVFEAARGEPADGKGPALVPEAGEKNKLKFSGTSGGRDVELVLVMDQGDADGKRAPLRETLTYRRDIAGTNLVYDLTGEFLQGKARPFVCDLTQQSTRLYALLPFQVEMLAVRAQQKVRVAKEGERTETKFEVAFQDGRGERVQGSLPCHATLLSPRGNLAWEQYLATGRDGSLSSTALFPQGATPAKWSLVVRSQLNGEEVTLPIEVVASDPAVAKDAEQNLTDAARRVRSNPQPWTWK